MNVKITGIGSYIPSEIAKNEHFGDHHFYNEDGTRFGQENETIIEKFKAITGIAERRYIQKTSTPQTLRPLRQKTRSKTRESIKKIWIT